MTPAPTPASHRWRTAGVASTASRPADAVMVVSPWPESQGPTPWRPAGATMDRGRSGWRARPSLELRDHGVQSGIDLRSGALDRLDPLGRCADREQRLGDGPGEAAP